jgi:anaerobic selenocysteine-containing dehydrogenase
MVDVKDGKIVRVRPFHYDWKYSKDSIKTWKMEKNGKTLEPPWKSLPSPFSLAYKKRIYSPNRIKYPLKCVDWDPKGERNPKIECIVAQHPWLENDCLYADIILPSNTHMEVSDIVCNYIQGTSIPNTMLTEKAVEPIGESKNNFECMMEVAKQFGLEDIVSEGKTGEELMKLVFGYMGTDRLITWEELQEKKYYLYSIAEDWEKDPLPIPPGRLEIYSERLEKEFPDDNERPPFPNGSRRAPCMTSDGPATVQEYSRWFLYQTTADGAFTHSATTSAGPGRHQHVKLPGGTDISMNPAGSILSMPKHAESNRVTS